MSDIINQILSHTDIFVSGLIGLCVIGGVVIEASPIPINPLKWLGSRLNQDIKEDIDILQSSINGLDSRLTKIENDALQSDLQAKRSIVLNFADRLRRTPYEKLGEVCTLEDFKNVVDVMDEYHELIVKYNIPNGRFDIARDYITDMFVDLSKKGKFNEKK